MGVIITRRYVLVRRVYELVVAAESYVDVMWKIRSPSPGEQKQARILRSGGTLSLFGKMACAARYSFRLMPREKVSPSFSFALSSVEAAEWLAICNSSLSRLVYLTKVGRATPWRGHVLIRGCCEQDDTEKSPRSARYSCFVPDREK